MNLESAEEEEFLELEQKGLVEELEQVEVVGWVRVIKNLNPFEGMEPVLEFGLLEFLEQVVVLEQFVPPLLDEL